MALSPGGLLAGERVEACWSFAIMIGRKPASARMSCDPEGALPMASKQQTGNKKFVSTPTLTLQPEELRQSHPGM
ncbi:MAG TPA: hypothetical protein VFU27_13850 [Terriglobales bacterium]|nr:hypothetical protein [Terriglobales bacterium]